jgi:hypothetical protein
MCKSLERVGKEVVAQSERRAYDVERRDEER